MSPEDKLKDLLEYVEKELALDQYSSEYYRIQRVIVWTRVRDRLRPILRHIARIKKEFNLVEIHD